MEINLKPFALVTPVQGKLNLNPGMRVKQFNVRTAGWTQFYSFPKSVPGPNRLQPRQF